MRFIGSFLGETGDQGLIHHQMKMKQSSRGRDKQGNQRRMMMMSKRVAEDVRPLLKTNRGGRQVRESSK
jgi:hypothetical protein